MNKTTLIDFLTEGVNEIMAFSQATPLDAFYFKPAENVWSAAENVQHLAQSAQPLNRLFGRPKSYFMEKWGPPNHPSQSYEAIIEAYHAALGTGRVATGVFVPMSPNPDITLLMEGFKQDYTALTDHIAQWEENEPDEYVIPHPLLGPLTVREMLLFTAYHLRHHHQIMVNRTSLAHQ
ncbi:DinB family protein [Runella sp.]|uniref:DinB family protein n=1 Tax=Runella sp. TaxID=1960881 RepID=UPI003D115ED7